VSLRAGWKLSEQFSMTASLENLLDEDYRVHGSGANEAGIGGTVGVTVNF
jgi:hemoglobin/transferrin/lactoferrin receptor protein